MHLVFASSSRKIFYHWNISLNLENFNINVTHEMYAHVSTPFLDRVRPRIILLSTWIPIKLMQCVSVFCFRWKWTSLCLATPTKILTSFSGGLLGTFQRTTSELWLVYLFKAVAKENILLYFFAYMIIATKCTFYRFLLLLALLRSFGYLCPPTRDSRESTYHRESFIFYFG